MASPPDDDEEALLSKLVQEGGVGLQNFLLSQAISQQSDEIEFSFIHDEDSNTPVAVLEAKRNNPSNWSSPASYCHLLADEKKKWDEACKEEIDGLKKRKVFEVVVLPKGCTPIKC